MQASGQDGIQEFQFQWHGTTLMKDFGSYRRVDGDCPVNLIWIRKNMVYLPTSTPPRRQILHRARVRMHSHAPPMRIGSSSLHAVPAPTGLANFTSFILKSTILSITGVILDRSARIVCLLNLLVWYGMSTHPAWSNPPTRDSWLHIIAQFCDSVTFTGL